MVTWVEGWQHPKTRLGTRRPGGLEVWKIFSKVLVVRSNETAVEKTREGLTTCFYSLLVGLSGSWQLRGCLWDIIAGDMHEMLLS